MIPPRLSGLFAVDDQVDVSRQWYERLGWQTERADHVFVPFPLAGTSFALWSADSAGPSVDAVTAAAGSFSGTLLSLVMDQEADVDAVLGSVVEAGGTVVVPAGERAFGRAGWFVDPAGTTWEVCWISGHGADDPFDGQAGASAVATALGAVTVYGTDPDAARSFYADGLGWQGRATSWAGRPALATDGALLTFAAADDVHPVGACGALMMSTADDVDALHGVLLAKGAESLAEPTDADGCRTAAVRDPKGLVWDVVHDPAWSCSAVGPLPRNLV